MVTASWWSGNEFVFEAGGLRFKSSAGQIEYSATNGCQKAVLRGRKDAEMRPANSLHALA